MNIAIVALNLAYAAAGGAGAIALMLLSYKALDRLTTFDTCSELKAGNRAVGTVVGGMFVGIGIAVGLVIGMALN